MADVSTILLDLDGVIRHFGEEARAAIERNNGLTLGALREAAFAQPLIDQVITGQMTRAAWTIEIGRRVGNFEAANTWLAQRGNSPGPSSSA